MSNIDMNGVHSVVEYTSGVTKPLSNQRLSVLYWKTGKDGIKKASKCVSIPTVVEAEVTANITALMPYLVDVVSKAQNGIIRELVESGSLHISNSDISIASVIEYLESSDSESGNRLTKESVAVWFDTKLADNLMLVLSEKLGISAEPSEDEITKLNTAVNMYKDKITALAGGKTSYPAPMAKSVLNCLNLVDNGSEDTIVSKFTVRLNKMINVQNDLMDLL